MSWRRSGRWHERGGKNAGNDHLKKRHIERYEHTGKKRTNNPPVGLVTKYMQLCPKQCNPPKTNYEPDYARGVLSVMAMSCQQSRGASFRMTDHTSRIAVTLE